MDPKQYFLAIILVQSQGLPTMKCQAKCAKAIFVSLFRHRDSRSARNGCHGYLWRLGKWADNQQSWNTGCWQLSWASLGKWADNEQSWNPGYWQLG